MTQRTEMRITENNVASPKIMLIQGQQQEATVESAEDWAPDNPGPNASVQWPPGHMGCSQGVSSSGLPVPQPGVLDTARVPFGRWFVCVRQLGRSGDGRFSGLGLADTVARKRKLPAANTITFVSYIPLLNVAIKCLPLCLVPR